MKIPVIAIYHDLTYFGGIESSELDLIKKLHNAGYKTIFAHKSQYFTQWNTIDKIKQYAEIIDITEQDINCDILIYSSLVFPYNEIKDKIHARYQIAWFHFIPGEQLNFTLLEDKEFISKMDCFVSVSEKTKRELDKYNYKNNSIIIHNTIDIDYIKQQAQDDLWLPINQDMLRLVTVSRISDGKGIERCIEVAKDLTNNKINYVWYIVGGGTQGYINALKEKSKDTNIIFIGYQDNPYRYIARCDYGVILTKEESWCLVVDECWVLGTPTITTEFDAIYERLNQDKYNIVVRQDLKDFDINEIIKQQPILKNNLKQYQHESDFNKWIELINKLTKY